MKKGDAAEQYGEFSDSASGNVRDRAALSQGDGATRENGDDTARH